MIERISGIQIKGKCFTQDTSLEFFRRDNKQTRLALVYGRNGSGKSVIADGFRSLTIHQDPAQGIPQIQASLLQEQGTVMITAPISSIHVFDECYVDKNIRVQGDGLGTIVLIGAQVELQDEIVKCEAEKNRLIKAVEDQVKEYAKYTESSSQLSPDFHFSRICNFLKGNWAEVDKNLKGNVVNTAVKDTVALEVCKLPDTEDKLSSELRVELDEQKLLYEKLKLFTTGFQQAISQITFYVDDELLVLSLLAAVIEEPVLIDREKLILKAVQFGAQSLVEAARKKFQIEGIDFCPYCFREIDNAYKSELVKNINRVLNADVDENKASLTGLIFPVLDYSDYDQYEDLDKASVKDIKEKVDDILETIAEYKKLITQKVNNVYQPIIIESKNLYGRVSDLNTELASLEQQRVIFNATLKKKSVIQRKAIELNKKIAHKEVKELYNDYLKAQEDKISADESLQKHRNSLRLEDAKLRRLQDQKSNTGIAIEKINWGLDYVFFNKKRLELKPSDGSYALLSNGCQVKPSAISVGERNIMALCYFFTEIFSNKEEDKLYKDEMLVVVDDPVSSFDIENRIGIMSFLRFQINKLLKGNDNSKILVLTHDLLTHFDLYRASKELCAYSDGKINYSYWELNGCKLDRLKDNKNEYKVLLESIYEYAACEGTFTDNNGIGNMMRRLLEAFSTFVYQKSSNEVICLPDVVALLGDRSDYYENLMFRLLLNNESHTESQMKTLESDGMLIDYFTDAEKKHTARDILSFIYAVNPPHLKAYFSNDDKLRTVKAWHDQVKTNSI